MEKESIFKEFLDELEEKFKVRTGWFSQYFGDGIFKLHHDKEYRAKYRLVTTIWSSQKKMTITNGDMEVTFKVPHGCVVGLSEMGGGVIGEAKHGITGAGNSMFLVFEVDTI